MGFLNISREAELHTISKTSGKWILIVQENYGKAQISQGMGFLHNSPENMGKVNSHTNRKIWEKVWENINIPKLHVY